MNDCETEPAGPMPPSEPLSNFDPRDRPVGGDGRNPNDRIGGVARGAAMGNLGGLTSADHRYEYKADFREGRIESEPEYRRRREQEQEKMRHDVNQVANQAQASAPTEGGACRPMSGKESLHFTARLKRDQAHSMMEEAKKLAAHANDLEHEARELEHLAQIMPELAKCAPGADRALAKLATRLW